VICDERIPRSFCQRVLSGSVTDAYFERTEEILSKAGKNPEVVMELHVKQFPSPDYGFGVLAGTTSNEASRRLTRNRGSHGRR